MFWWFQVSEAEMNGQFESVCESVFSEVESQAMEALDLPGCFRTRSHSYLRAIQAGYSQDDECVPSMSSSTVTSTIRSTAGESPGWGSIVHHYEKPWSFRFNGTDREINTLKLYEQFNIYTTALSSSPFHLLIGQKVSADCIASLNHVFLMRSFEYVFVSIVTVCYFRDLYGKCLTWFKANNAI